VDGLKGLNEKGRTEIPVEECVQASEPSLPPFLPMQSSEFAADALVLTQLADEIIVDFHE